MAKTMMNGDPILAIQSTSNGVSNNMNLSSHSILNSGQQIFETKGSINSISSSMSSERVESIENLRSQPKPIEKVFKVCRKRRYGQISGNTIPIMPNSWTNLKNRNKDKQFWHYNIHHCRESMLRELFSHMKPHRLYDCNRIAEKVFDMPGSHS
jgi:hypothetical protein